MNMFNLLVSGMWGTWALYIIMINMVSELLGACLRYIRNLVLGANFDKFQKNCEWANNISINNYYHVSRHFIFLIFPKENNF